MIYPVIRISSITIELFSRAEGKESFMVHY